ncbi:MAG TPA: RodZ domain-containing protein [Rhizomicrobium sp.]|nr:RodZ domain-containing protein [Rhizomicrobium sp.]
MTKVTRLTVDDGGNIKSRRIHLREISGDSDTPLETVGQDLRAARLRRGDDLATVSKVLKIRKDHLEAIEEDRLEQLPGRTYAVGFVRSYADYLGLDTAQCLERFKAEIAGRSDSDNVPAVTVIDEDEHRRLPQGWIIIAAVIVALMIYGAYYVLTSTSSMTAEPVAAPPSQQVAPKPVARVLPPPVQRPVQQSAPATIPALTPSTQGAAPGPAPSPTTQPAANATAPAAVPPPASLPQGQVFGANNHGARVVLRVHQTTRILIQGEDGMVYINRTLQPGDSYQVPNVVGLTLTTTNANAVEIDLDGESKGFAGKQPGVAEGLQLDPQSIVDRTSGGQQ